jgi:4-amino-4-deoxy-L-arabinose transferase-like glycosyltransferase
MAASTLSARNTKVSDIWATVLFAFVVCAGLGLALLAASAPQCCDATGYHQEGTALFARGWGGGWLVTWKHNYLYPALHGAMIAAGVGDRVSIAILQLALLYTSVAFLAVAIARVFQRRLAPILAGLSLVALLPAAAWSGYWLTEAITTPVTLALIACWLLFALRPTPSLAIAVGMLSGLVWMSRAAFVWLPPLAAAGIVVALRRESSQRRRLLSVALFVVGLVAVVLPQWLIASSVDGLLHLSNAGYNARKAPAIFRAATNLSSCGEQAMVFSPLTSQLDSIDAGTVRAPESMSWRVAAGVAHVVSGWDPRPSPTYAANLSQWPWFAVTLLSGLVMLAPLKLAADERRRETATAAVGLLVLFLVTQAQLAVTPVEFRYNVIGWLVSGVSLVVLGRSIDRRYLAWAGALTALVVLIGQFTLYYSPAWNACAG